MKTYKSMHHALLKIILCLILVLLCFCADAYVQPAKLMIYNNWLLGGTFVFNLHSGGTLETAYVDNVSPEGFKSLEIEDFSDGRIRVKSKKLSFKEKMVVNRLITDVKNNSDSNYQANVEDVSMIFARIDETFYETTYYDEWPDGNVNLRTLTHKLVEFSSIT